MNKTKKEKEKENERKRDPISGNVENRNSSRQTHSIRIMADSRVLQLLKFQHIFCKYQAERTEHKVQKHRLARDLNVTVSNHFYPRQESTQIQKEFE